MVIGDFNCQPSSRFYSTLNHLISDNNLVMTDITLLENVFTYCSDSGASTSWIYHVITSQAVHNCVKSINVIYDYTCSDHRPLTVTLCCNVCIPSISNNVFLTSAPRCSYVASDWANADPSVISLYRLNLDYILTDVVVPSCLINCRSQKCNDSAHAAIIDGYYYCVIECVKHVVESTIPTRTLHDFEYNIPG